MKKRIFSILVILIIFGTVTAKIVVAKVGENKIYLDQLTQKIQNMESIDDISYHDLRKIALENLIEEELLLIYAKDNNLNASEDELDSFFIDQLGDHPRFQSEGLFDFDKFEEFKETENGKNILTEMGKEILIRKAKTLIISNFNITDEILLREYILNNAEIDISYSIINVEDVNTTEDFTHEDAKNYFYNNRREFLTSPRVKFEFFIIPNKQFKDTVEDYFEIAVDQIIPEDSLLTTMQKDSIKTQFITKEIRYRAQKEAEEQRYLLEQNGRINYPIFSSPLLAENEMLGNIPVSVTNKALEMQIGEFSQPIDIGIGFLVFKVIEFKKPEYLELNDSPQLVWEKYVQKRKEQHYENQFRSYFSKNIDDFIIPVSVVEILQIKKPIYKLNLSNDEFLEDFKMELIKNGDNQRSISYLADKYNLKEMNLIVMLEKFSNKDELKDSLAVVINSGFKRGILKIEGKNYYYRETTYFPEYIPSFNDIKDQIPDIQYNNQMSEQDYLDFFEEHAKEFRTPDSLQLGGAYFLIQNDSIAIDSTMVYEYYRDNLDSYYQDSSVKFDYIAVRDRNNLHTIRNYLLGDADFQMVKYVYSNELTIPVQRYVQYEELPLILSEQLEILEKNELSYPIEYEGQWIILKKEDSKNKGVREFDEVKDDIGRQLLDKISDEIISRKAQTAFDSTSYYSQIFSFADSTELFKTKYQSVNEEFAILGDMKQYSQEMMRFWRNEKYNSIIKLPENKGYAVIYILKKKPSREMKYEEALPQIKNNFTSKKTSETAKEYVKSLRGKIVNGEDPDELLFFLGGWKREENLDFDSNIFGTEWSRLILEDVASHEEGYLSPVLSLSEKQLLFYQINRLKKIPREQFIEEKDEFREKILDENYTRWLSQFRDTIGVSINIY